MSSTGRISPPVIGSTTPRLAAWALAAAVLAACSGGERGRAAAPPVRDEVVVASFNFPESELVAEIYAGALEAADIPVRREMGLGPRELVQPALLSRLVDVVPEYLGTALASVAGDPGVDPSDTDAVWRRLADEMARWDVRVLSPAPAQNQNGLVVTRRTADRLALRTVSDLSAAGAAVSLAGPAECPYRPYCLAGLERVYGLRFRQFVPFDTEHQRVTALREEVVDAAVMFTTDGELAAGDLVLLDDDRRLQPAEHLVPLVSSAVADRFGGALVEALESVSARLTSQNLVFLNWRVAVAGKDIAAEARGWLERHGLTEAPR